MPGRLFSLRLVVSRSERPRHTHIASYGGTVVGFNGELVVPLSEPYSIDFVDAAFGGPTKALGRRYDCRRSGVLKSRIPLDGTEFAQ